MIGEIHSFSIWCMNVWIGCQLKVLRCPVMVLESEQKEQSTYHLPFFVKLPWLVLAQCNCELRLRDSRLIMLHKLPSLKFNRTAVHNKGVQTLNADLCRSLLPSGLPSSHQTSGRFHKLPAPCRGARHLWQLIITANLGASWVIALLVKVQYLFRYMLYALCISDLII